MTTLARYDALYRRLDALTVDLLAAERRQHELTTRIVEMGTILEKIPNETIMYLERVKRLDLDDYCPTCDRWVGFPAGVDCLTQERHPAG